MQEHVCPCPWLARSFSSTFANVSAGGKAGRWMDPQPSPLLTNPSSSEENPRPLNEPSSHWRRPRGCKSHPVLHQHTTKKEGFRGNCSRDATGPGPRHRQLKDTKKTQEMPKTHLETPKNDRETPKKGQQTSPSPQIPPRQDGPPLQGYIGDLLYPACYSRVDSRELYTSPRVYMTPPPIGLYRG